MTTRHVAVVPAPDALNALVDHSIADFVDSFDVTELTHTSMQYAHSIARTPKKCLQAVSEHSGVINGIKQLFSFVLNSGGLPPDIFIN